MPVALAVRDAGGQEAGKLARDGPAGAVPGDAPERRFGGVRKGWLTTVTGRKPAHAMLNIRGLARGCCAPLRPPASRADVGASDGGVVRGSPEAAKGPSWYLP